MNFVLTISQRYFTVVDEDVCFRLCSATSTLILHSRWRGIIYCYHDDLTGSDDKFDEGFPKKKNIYLLVWTLFWKRMESEYLIFYWSTMVVVYLRIQCTCILDFSAFRFQVWCVGTYFLFFISAEGLKTSQKKLKTVFLQFYSTGFLFTI